MKTEFRRFSNIYLFRTENIMVKPSFYVHNFLKNVLVAKKVAEILWKVGEFEVSRDL